MKLDTVYHFPDGSACFVAEIDTRRAPPDNPVYWNGYNKVVQDHRDGTIHHDLTNTERAKRGLPTPWTPEMADDEVFARPNWYVE